MCLHGYFILKLIERDPLGPLTTASCALASYHNKALRVSRNLEQLDPVPHQSTSAQFYQRAFWQLASKTNEMTAAWAQPSPEGAPKPNYDVTVVLAALHCVAYFLMQGGLGEWPLLLSVARQWLEKKVESTPEDVKQMYVCMTDAEKLALKVTMVSTQSLSV